MALSLNDIKNKKGAFTARQRADLPKKVPTMPWQDKAPDASADSAAAEQPIEAPPSTGENVETQSEPNPIPLQTRSRKAGTSEKSETDETQSNPTPETQSKPEPDPIQTRGEPAPETQSKPEPDPIQTRASLAPKPNPNPLQNPIQTRSIDRLSDLQLRILDRMFQTCWSTGSRQTEKMLTKQTYEAVKATYASYRTAVQRLIAASCIARIENKPGPQGWTIFRISDGAYAELVIRHKQENPSQTRSETQSNSAPKPNPTGSPTSSSLNINTSTTTGTGDADWSVDDIDISEQALQDAGLSRQHIEQLRKRGTIDRFTLQRSIDYFAYALLTRQHNHDNPLRVFMHSMIHRYGYLPPADYEAKRELSRKAWQDATDEIERRSQNTADVTSETDDAEFEKSEWAGVARSLVQGASKGSR